jgi:2-dehydro-3-deoxygalactonokinase
VLRESCGDWLDLPRCACAWSAAWPAAARAGRRRRIAPAPAGFDELARALTWITPGKVALVPGLSLDFLGTPDVLRGEEVQVFGAMDLLQLQEGVFVLPGTHCKWVRVAEGRVQSFTTFMSGEFYACCASTRSSRARCPPEDGRSTNRPSCAACGMRSRPAPSCTVPSAPARWPCSTGCLPAAFQLPVGAGDRRRTAQPAPCTDWTVVLIGEPGAHRSAMRWRCAASAASRAASAPRRAWRGLWALARSWRPAMNPLLAEAWRRALDDLPLVAILRGIAPAEVDAVGDALWNANWRVFEVPLNSPQPLESIARLARRFPGAVVGAGHRSAPKTKVQQVHGGRRAPRSSRRISIRTSCAPPPGPAWCACRAS